MHGNMDYLFKRRAQGRITWIIYVNNEHNAG